MHLACLTITGQTRGGTLYLFSDEMKTMTSPVVFDFLERYLYEVSQSKRGYDFYRRMADDKVVVREGSLDNIAKLSPAIPFTMTRYEDKGYSACWADTTGVTLLSIQFPIQFELLLGKTKEELEKAFKEELQKYSPDYTPTTPDSTLEPVDSILGLLRPATVTHYYVESLNTATYYQKGKGVPTPVFTPDDKWHSAINLLQGVVDSCQYYMLHVEQTLYGFQTQSFNIELTKWLNYCSKNRMEIFIGIEEERRDGLKALLIARDKDLGYNHMLSIILPDNFVEKRDVVLKATANTYIRTDNVDDMYNDKTKKNKKK